MKLFAYSFLILFIGLSCRSNPCRMKASEFNTVGAFIGKVHMNEDTCPLYLEIVDVTAKSTIRLHQTIYPVNLATKYKKKGLYLQFNYDLSRAMSPEGCNTDAVVSLTDVKAISYEK